MKSNQIMLGNWVFSWHGHPSDCGCVLTRVGWLLHVDRFGRILLDGVLAPLLLDAFKLTHVKWHCRGVVIPVGVTCMPKGA